MLEDVEQNCGNQTIRLRPVGMTPCRGFQWDKSLIQERCAWHIWQIEDWRFWLGRSRFSRIGHNEQPLQLVKWKWFESYGLRLDHAFGNTYWISKWQDARPVLVHGHMNDHATIQINLHEYKQGNKPACWAWTLSMRSLNQCGKLK